MKQEVKRYNAKELRDIYLERKEEDKNKFLLYMIFSGMSFLVLFLGYFLYVGCGGIAWFFVFLFLMVVFLIGCLLNYNNWVRTKKLIEVNR